MNAGRLFLWNAGQTYGTLKMNKTAFREEKISDKNPFYLPGKYLQIANG